MDGSEEVLVACDMPEPCEFLSFDGCQKRFMWTKKGVDLAPHRVVGLVLHVGDAEEFPHVTEFESLDPFLRVSKKGPCITAIEEDGGYNRLAELEFACEAGGVA